MTKHRIEDHREYIKNEKLKSKFDEMRDNIKKISLRESPTKAYVGYKFGGNVVGWLRANQYDIVIGTYNLDRTEDNMNVTFREEDYTRIIEKMKEYCRYRGGKL